RIAYLVVLAACGGGGGGGGDDVPSCPEAWQCTSWEAPPGSDQATPTCVDLNNAGSTECKPATGPVTLPALDLELYKCEVHPIFQRGCAMMGCHGTDTERPLRLYARGRLRNKQIVPRTGTCIPQTGTVDQQVEGSGTVMCEGWLPHTAEEWKKSFDSSRSFMLDVASPAQSPLLVEPTFGGPPHAGIKMFRAG